MANNSERLFTKVVKVGVLCALNCKYDKKNP